MKSVKEKSEEYGKDWYKRNGSLLDRCRGCYAHVTSSYEAGANYVLEQIEKLTNNQNWCAFPKQSHKELKELIEQLKK